MLFGFKVARTRARASLFSCITLLTHLLTFFFPRASRRAVYSLPETADDGASIRFGAARLSRDLPEFYRVVGSRLWYAHGRNCVALNCLSEIRSGRRRRRRGGEMREGGRESKQQPHRPLGARKPDSGRTTSSRILPAGYPANQSDYAESG